MPAPAAEAKTAVEIQEAAMNVLIEVLGGDDDSNIADTLSAHKIKDPSLILSLSDEEIGDLKINRGQKLSFINGKLLMLFKKYHNYQHYLGKSIKLEDWGETFTKDDFDNYRATAYRWNADDGLPHDAVRVRPRGTSAVNVGAHAITSAGPKPIDEVATFKKGMRRDATLFKEFKEQRNWHQCWLETRCCRGSRS